MSLTNKQKALKRVPKFLKKWILSDKGHLSNVHACSLIQEKGKNLSLALLGHLSENNNTKEVDN